MNLFNKKITMLFVGLVLCGFANFANSGDITTKLKYVRNIEVGEKTEGIAAVSLDQEVYENIDNFSDIRIVGTGDEEIPFRIRQQYAKKKEVRRVICSSKVISLKKLDKNRIEIVLQNRDSKRTPRYLTIRTPNKNYDKKVSIANGNSVDRFGKTKEDQAIFDYSAIINLSNTT